MRPATSFQPAPLRPVFAATPVAIAAAVMFALAAPAVLAQQAAPAAPADGKALSTVTVNASADASAQGLSPAYAGGQVARGGRAGVLGTKDAMDTPFSITSYTNEFIQDRHARSVGDVLQNDPTVRVARGFGNFQEAYFIRGFILDSDDTAYNGLYSLLPRQYIATELFERVEVLRGASAFLSGASPNGGGIGGSINLLPKRAPNEPLNRVTFGVSSGGQTQLAADIARRFGPDGNTGIRVNAATHNGGTAVDHEDVKLGLAAVGLDWRSRDVRLSGDIGWQDHKLKSTRTNVTLGATAMQMPTAPDGGTNFAQPWTYSNERDTFGTLRGEWDITQDITGWAAAGARRSSEANSLANLTVSDSSTGAGSTYRFDNTRKDSVNTGELGLRGKLQTGSVGHEWVVVASHFSADKKNAYAMDFANTQSTNLYNPVYSPLPGFSAGAFRGGDLADPRLTGSTRLTSFAIGDTLSLLDKRLLLTGGLRHQTIEIANYAYGTAAETDRYDQNRTSPLLAAVYKLDKSLSLYGNYVEGLSQGATAPSTAANRGEMLSPYVAKQKEVGVKFDGGRFGGSVALFSTTKPRAYVGSDNIFRSNGKDRHQGIELAVQGEATKGLRLLGGLTWLEAKQLNTGTASTDGRRVIGVPKLQANIGAEWDVPGVNGLALDGRLVHTGSVYANATNTISVPGWNRLDVGVRYLTEVQGRLVTLRARVDNLTNRNYWASSGGYPGAGYLVVGAPRTLSVSVGVDF
ncbi:TonB-dependent receptor [Acidovorax sp. Leaf76]|uniref:TonB-dependent receptor n=1 Tax=unclassified Acidovorax TaxID=2684926 RepID=UPI0006FB2E34|nr:MULTISPECIES: TonB-dependent receptor [unclassified Acidovorax]KQO25904.1 TonB-dependent receptor [Acidovorax sp. Leaf76]KQO28753.1 TonB-dependent receptor [Acidovorax sp. Leaf84]KQS40686.1 TonB-dependent receptor [Acidovorax sp. Leaf191]